MKKVIQYSLLIITCSFIAFIAGLFLSRDTAYRLSMHADIPEETPVIEEEIIVNTTEAYIDGKMNINAAGKEDLTLLPGIGDVTAERIIDYRRENGYFKDIDDLLLVNGIGDATLSKIRNYITVGKTK